MPETREWSIMVNFGETTSIKELFLDVAAELRLKQGKRKSYGECWRVVISSLEVKNTI